MPVLRWVLLEKITVLRTSAQSQVGRVAKSEEMHGVRLYDTWTVDNYAS